MKVFRHASPRALVGAAIWIAAPAAPLSAADGKPVHERGVFERKPLLRELMSDVVFWANFEDSPEPVMGDSFPEDQKPVSEPYDTAPGLVGRAYLSREGGFCRYPAQGNWDLRRPGGLAFWACPAGWDRSSEAGIRNGLFRSNFSQEGYLGISRVGTRKDGPRVVEHAQVYFYAHYYPDSPNLTVGLGDSLGEDWADGKWHLFVVNWKGAHLEVSLDGSGLKSNELGAPVAAGGVTELLIGCSKEPTLLDEFMIFRRPLTAGDVQVLMGALHPDVSTRSD